VINWRVHAVEDIKKQIIDAAVVHFDESGALKVKRNGCMWPLPKNRPIMRSMIKEVNKPHRILVSFRILRVLAYMTTGNHITVSTIAPMQNAMLTILDI